MYITDAFVILNFTDGKSVFRHSSVSEMGCFPLRYILLAKKIIKNRNLADCESL